MTTEHRDLITLADAIAERAPVDWAEADAAASDDVLRTTLRELRVIAEIAAFHGQVDTLNRAERWGPLALLEHVGHGSFGDVYRALDTRLDREVALKLMRRPDTTDDRRGTAVIDEARHLARVRHPNVVTIYGADRIDGRVGLWMEFVRGRTLEALVREHGGLPEGVVASIGAGICRAVAAVHDAGLLHRDIKAQNVMQEPGGRLVLMDFGAGGELAADGDGDPLAGTPLYLAPEVLEGHPATVQSDVYSLGVLLHHLLTGAYPVTGRTIQEIRDGHRRGGRASLGSDVSPALARVILRALESDPGSRYQHVADMTAALEATSAAATAGSRRRMLALAAVLTVIVAVAGAWLHSTRPDRTFADSLESGMPPEGMPIGALLQDQQSDPRFRRVCYGCGDVGGSIDGSGQWMVLTDRSRSTKTWGLAVRNLKSPLDTAWLQFQDNRPDAWPAYFPVISSDARLVAYREPGRPTQLRVIANAVGSEPSTVSVDAPEARAITPAAWKADNSSILVTIVRQDGSAALAWVSRADGAVRLLKDLGWRLRDVVGRPALSPDGQYLAYSALATDPGAKGAIDSAYRRIYVLKADGSAGETAVVAGSPINDAPIWTQDGSRLLFVSNPSGRIDLRAVDVRDGAAQGVPSILWRDLGCRCFIPHHVSAGGVVYFTRDVPAEEHTVIVKMESPGARIKGKAPIVSEVLDGSLPAWSHNGQAIATRMIRERGKRTPNSDDYDTTVYWLGTNQRIRYDLGGTQRTPVRWLHHDEAFLETVREDGQPDSALRVDVRNRESRRIIDYHPSFNTATMARSSEVSGDDKTLYVIRRNPADSQIVAFDLATGEQSVIVTLPLTAFSVKLSPDSRTLAYVGRDAAATHLGRVDVTGESHRELYALTDSRVRQIRPMVAWTSDGQGILFVQEEELSTPLPSPVPPDRQDRGSRNQNMRFRQRVMHIPADGRDGPSPTGLEVIAASLQEMSLSPNGERLAYGVGTGGFELWALDLTRVLQGASK